MQGCLISNGGKTGEKNLGAKFVPNESQLSLKLVSTLFSQVFLEIAYSDNLQQYIKSSRGKTQKKFLEPIFGLKLDP